MRAPLMSPNTFTPFQPAGLPKQQDRRSLPLYGQAAPVMPREVEPVAPVARRSVGFLEQNENIENERPQPSGTPPPQEKASRFDQLYEDSLRRKEKQIQKVVSQQLEEEKENRTSSLGGKPSRRRSSGTYSNVSSRTSEKDIADWQERRILREQESARAKAEAEYRELAECSFKPLLVSKQPVTVRSKLSSGSTTYSRGQLTGRKSSDSVTPNFGDEEFQRRRE